jgi:ectoine hydroxylase-related dioxygenase (phytanoyl-CoA dioxygenase family)
MMALALAEADLDLRSGLITESDFAAYRANGAICVRGVIDQLTVEALRLATAKAIEAKLAEDEAQGVPRPVGPFFHILRNVYDQHEAFRKVLFDSKIAAVARDVMQSRKVVVFGDSLFDKEAGASTTTPWHHDVPFWPVRGDQVCTTWIALDYVNKANGAMEYVSGSHRWNRMFRPKYPNGALGDANPLHAQFEEIPDFDNLRDEHDFLYWELEPGDVLIHDGMTVHGAGVNTLRDLSRRAYAPRFVGDEAWWDPAFASEKTPAAAKKLAKGDPLDRHGAFPVALDLAAS